MSRPGCFGTAGGEGRAIRSFSGKAMGKLMSGDCCTSAGESSAGIPSCPACGCRSQSVESSTVAALVAGPVPAHQKFWLCRDRDCEVTYFGDAGARFRISNLRFLPAFKSESPEALVCFCFLHPRMEIESELRHSGTSTLVDRIAAKVKARDCACEVRNPSGRCCLADVRAETGRLRDALDGEHN
ncbi:MAG: putative iron-sulfur cluster-binding metallochaperone [Thermoanaerobaculia bacterium]